MVSGKEPEVVEAVTTLKGITDLAATRQSVSEGVKLREHPPHIALARARGCPAEGDFGQSDEGLPALGWARLVGERLTIEGSPNLPENPG